MNKKKKGDGCTLFPDGNYRPCCDIHDQAYGPGGTDAERRLADLKLQSCVSRCGWGAGEACLRYMHDKPVLCWFAWFPILVIPVFYALLGACMYFGVRMGGARWHKFGWQWGFGADAKKTND